MYFTTGSKRKSGGSSIVGLGISKFILSILLILYDPEYGIVLLEKLPSQILKPRATSRKVDALPGLSSLRTVNSKSLRVF